MLEEGLHRRATRREREEDVQQTDVLASYQVQVLGGALAAAEAEESATFLGRGCVFSQKSEKGLKNTELE